MPADVDAILLAKGSADVVYVLGTTQSASVLRWVLLRSGNDGASFQAVTAPPASPPTARSLLRGDGLDLDLVSAGDGYAALDSYQDGADVRTLSFATPERGLALTTTGAVFATANAGKRWWEVHL